MEFNTERALEVYYENKEDKLSQKEAAQQVCKEIGIPYESKYLHRLNRLKIKKENSLDNCTTTVTNQYSNDKEDVETFMPSAWDSEKKVFLSIDDYCEKYNLPKEQVRSSKLVTHQKSHMTYNIAFNATLHEQTGIDETIISEIVKKNFERKYFNATSVNSIDNSEYWDRLVLTDIHIGMDVNGNRNVEPLYKGKWDEEELYRRLDLLIKHIETYKKGDVLVIDDLGDYMDGLFGQTTRKGHELPQNMTDVESFDLGVSFKCKLIDKLISIYKKIVFNSVTNDNHSGVFSYFVNKSVKEIVELKYDNIEYNIIRKFIDHYKMFNDIKVLTHGKDMDSLKFGFKPILDTKQIESIDQYLKEHKLFSGKNIEFSKGDSHQHIFDYTTSNDFWYFNYPAFSPPSNWVKTNFKNTASGFVFFNINKENSNHITIPYYFK